MIKDFRFIKVIDVPDNKLLLDSSVESFQITVRFRMLWVIIEMYQAIIPARLFEIFGEFTTIVDLNPRSNERSDFGELTRKSLPLADEFDL